MAAQNRKPTAKNTPKPASKAAAKPKQSEREDPEIKIESAIGRTERFIYDNGKNLIAILAVIVIVIGGYIGYKHLYMSNRAEKAAVMIYVAEHNFADQMYDIALNGDGNNYGFLDVISKYGSTPQGNIARHYAGICYLKMDDLDSALDYLNKYKATKGVPNQIINAQNLGLQGDIYVQKGDYNKAVERFNKAVAAGDNSLSAPYYLKKLGLAYEKLGRNSDAISAYQRVADEYPTSMEAREIEKFIGATQQK